MDTTKDVEASPARTRRHLILGAATLLVVGAGGGGYFLWSRPGEAVAQPAGGAEGPVAELLKPDPLGGVSQGDDKAPRTIVRYASMTCPPRAPFHQTTYTELKKKYNNTGQER